MESQARVHRTEHGDADGQSGRGKGRGERVLRECVHEGRESEYREGHQAQR